MVLTSLSKHMRKDFQIIIGFGHSAITSQSMFVLRNGAEKILSLSNIQKMSAPSNESCLYIRTYTYCTTVSVERCLSKDGSVMNILAKSPWRRTTELQLL